jgi:ATP-dependent RNA helicase DDX46/PRP5
LEAWKAKQLAKNEGKAKEAAANDPAKAAIVAESTRSASATPAATSPPQSTTSSMLGSPKPHAKFDPKAVIKKATHGASTKSALGLDVSLPTPAQKSATTNKFHANSAANNHKGASATSSACMSLPLHSKVGGNTNLHIVTNGSNEKLAGKVSGFGLGAGQNADQSSKVAMDLEDEKESKRTLEKLNIPLSEDQDDDAALANGEEDDDENSPIVDEDDHEAALKALEARRVAAEGAEVNEEQDVAMQDVQEPSRAAPQEDQVMADVGGQEEEEVDPLDAFMEGLSAAPTPALPTFSSLRGRRNGPEAIFAEESAYDEVHGEAEDDMLAVAARKKAKKELKKIDHKKIDYEEFTKNFYTETEETQELTEEDVANLRFEMEQIQVRGKDIPKPVDRWSAMGLSAQVQQVIAALGYTKPTPIQAQAIPSIMSGRDLIGVAKTGSGKTMAFLLPMFRHIKAQRPLKKTPKLGSEGPIAVVLAPTRELADQIGRECKPFAKALGLSVAICFGQASLKDNIDKIKLGVEIIVATPGRLIDLATVNSGNLLSFSRTTYMVLDEADRLWDMGFAPQVKMILSQIRPDRQFVMFSATFPNNLEVLAKEMLKERPVQITIGGRATVAKEIELKVDVLERSERLKRLLQILGEKYAEADWSPLNRELWQDQTLVFVERQEAATELLGALMKRGFTKISYIHGSREQDERVAAITDFKNGHYPILIATSIAARGLDVKNLKLVINYDVPRHLEDFVHRAGRTGRAGNTGTCITFLTPDDMPYAADVVKAFKYSDREVPPKVEELSNAYKKKIKSGEVKYTTKGFGGHGVEKFDQARDLERKVLRKQAGLDEPKADDGKDPDEEGTPGEDIAIKVQARDGDKKDGAETPIEGAAKAASPAPAPKPKTNDPYANLDEYNIKVHKRVVEPTPDLPLDPLARARAKALEISGRKGGVAAAPGGAVSAGHNRDNKGPDAGAFHATLEINDYPQKARWAVTNRTNVKNILDQYSVSITSKGVFYKLGEGPKNETEQPKLYLLVEGDTENNVMGAMRDLVRLLKEGIVHDMEASARQPKVGGRYSLI